MPRSKLNLKVHHIYLKTPFETSNTYKKIYFERAYLGENVTKLLKQKVAQNVAISLGTSSFQKVTTGIQK
jgi:hypothetical protein